MLFCAGFVAHSIDLGRILVLVLRLRVFRFASFSVDAAAKFCLETTVKVWDLFEPWSTSSATIGRERRHCDDLTDVLFLTLMKRTISHEPLYRYLVQVFHRGFVLCEWSDFLGKVWIIMFDRFYWILVISILQMKSWEIVLHVILNP